MMVSDPSGFEDHVAMLARGCQKIPFYNRGHAYVSVQTELVLTSG